MDPNASLNSIGPVPLVPGPEGTLINMPQLDPIIYEGGEDSSVFDDAAAAEDDKLSTHSATKDSDFECESPYQCKICNKMFAIPARLQRHHRVHTGEKPFKCEFCDKTFSVKENLNVHRRIHTKERPYQCNICNRAFEHSGKLHRHMRTHTGERPHKCELCGKTFVQSGQLVIHMRAHTGEKPYTCDYCQKGFTCSKQLKVHIRTHTGEKPYECDICGKTFGYNHVLKMHKMSHLGEKLYKCTLCKEFFNSRKALDRHIKDHNQETRGSHPNSSDQSNELEPVQVSLPRKKRIQSSPATLKLDIPPQMNQTFRDKGNTPYTEQGDQSPAESRRELDLAHGSPTYTSDGRARGFSPISAPLTPPRSPDNDGPPITTTVPDPSLSPSSIYPPKQWDNKSVEEQIGNLYSFMKSRSASWSSTSDSQDLPPLPQLAFFTTITGERLACPIDLLVRLQGPNSAYEPDHVKIQRELHESMKIQRELHERLRREEFCKQREKSFCDSVLKVLESCIGDDRLQHLGYPNASIDEVIMNTLKLMGTQPCWEPSLAPMDRIKVNLRLLLECCVPDQELWNKFGWKGKSIEEIVSEFLQHC